MKLRLVRYGFGADSTLGKLYDDDGLVCFTLEDERRAVKVPGETCIPVGTYRVTLRDEGGLTVRYRNRFPDMHKGMLWLRDVPGFEWVYLHIGNTDDHTEGCPLVGEVPVVLPDGEFQLARSEAAYRKLYPFIAGAIALDEDVTLTVEES